MGGVAVGPLREQPQKRSTTSSPAAGRRQLKAKAGEFTTYAHAVFKILETV
jgi:hypothetical protein